MNLNSPPRAGGPSRRRTFAPAEKFRHLAAYDEACRDGEGRAYLPDRRSPITADIVIVSAPAHGGGGSPDLLVGLIPVPGGQRGEHHRPNGVLIIGIQADSRCSPHGGPPAMTR